MAKERADLGFSDALDDFDPADWAPRKPRPPAAATRKAAAAAGFRSREPQPEPAEPPPAAAAVEQDGRRDVGQGGGVVPGTAGQGPRPRRRRTGRTAQLNLKLRPETVAAFCALADREGWGLGETLERALEALEARRREKGR